MDGQGTLLKSDHPASLGSPPVPLLDPSLCSLSSCFRPLLTAQTPPWKASSPPPDVPYSWVTSPRKPSLTPPALDNVSLHTAGPTGQSSVPHHSLPHPCPAASIAPQMAVAASSPVSPPSLPYPRILSYLEADFAGAALALGQVRAALATPGPGKETQGRE